MPILPHSTQVRRCLQLVLAALAMSCASASTQGRLDPDAIGTDQGTLVSLGDIRSVATEMVQSMNASTTLGRIRAEQKPVRVLVGHFKQRTSIAIFDKDLFVNRVLASLLNADTSGAYAFIRRGSVPAEDARELSTGADLILTGEVRELLHREATPRGGELERRTVQYTLAVTRVSDDAIIWTDSKEVVKQQITGAVYR